MMEKAMATHSSTLAWRIPVMGEPGRLQSMGSLWVGHNWTTHFHFSLSCIREGNGNPLQCSCLENPRDGGAWWAAVYGVAQHWTWLKWLSSSNYDINRVKTLLLIKHRYQWAARKVIRHVLLSVYFNFSSKQWKVNTYKRTMECKYINGPNIILHNTF